MHLTIRVFVLLLMLSACGKKKKAEVAAEKFLPTDTYIKGQVAQLDTAAAAFIKIETTADKTDTAAITNAEAKALAKDFLAIPDISAKDVKDDYEPVQMFDDLQNAFVFTYNTKDDHPVKREDLVVETDTTGQSKIRSIFVTMDVVENSKPFTKNLFWEWGNRFEIVNVGADGTKRRTVVAWVK